MVDLSSWSPQWPPTEPEQAAAPEPEAGRAAPRQDALRQAELERQLRAVAQRLAGWEAKNGEWADALSDRLQVLEQIFTKINGHGLMSRMSRIEQMCQEVRADMGHSWCKLEMRIGARLAGLRDAQEERARWERWERRSCVMERRIANLEEGAAVARIASGADGAAMVRRDSSAGTTGMARRASTVVSADRARSAFGANEERLDLEAYVFDLERRIEGLEELEDFASRRDGTGGSGQEFQKPKGASRLGGGVSDHWMLDLDKQVFDMGLEVQKLRERLQGQDARPSAAADPKAVRDKLQAALGDLSSKAGAAEACRRDLDNRLSDLAGRSEAKVDALHAALGEVDSKVSAIEACRRDLDDRLADLAGKSEARVDALHAALGEMDSKVGAVEACCQDLSHRLRTLDLERLQEGLGWKRYSAPASTKAELECGLAHVTHFAL